MTIYLLACLATHDRGTSVMNLLDDPIAIMRRIWAGQVDVNRAVRAHASAGGGAENECRCHRADVHDDQNERDPPANAEDYCVEFIRIVLTATVWAFVVRTSWAILCFCYTVLAVVANLSIC